MKGRITTVLLSFALGAALLVPQSALAADQKRPTSESQKVQFLMSELNRGAQVLDVAAPEIGGGPRQGPDDIIVCPEGYHPSPFEMPVYDENGLFVVGYETVWFCIPDDLEPAG